jgi:hypothetical protein
MCSKLLRVSGSLLAVGLFAGLNNWLQADGSAPAPETSWVFTAPHKPALPPLRIPGWIRNPVDAFILAKLEAKGLVPSPPADKLMLLRRVTFDLTGLPTTVADQEAFLADPSSDAYEKVVDRLLASPHYGERWAVRDRLWR